MTVMADRIITNKKSDRTASHKIARAIAEEIQGEALRVFDHRETVRQVGPNIWAVSGGRYIVVPDSDGGAAALILPAGQGHHVVITLAPWDTYRVRRFYVRGGKAHVKDDRGDMIYFDDLGEECYRASIRH